MDEELFELRLGRIRASGSGRERKYLHAVLASTARAGGFKQQSRSRFNGSRIGRGSVVARVLAAGNPHVGFRSRRAIIKIRIVRLGTTSLAALRAHLRYIERDGAAREEEGGRLYSAIEDGADGRAFLERSAGDRHQFRVIASPEDAAEYQDLRPLIRRFMGRMENDLGTSLEWVAADHCDTLHPHAHIILRGKDERGDDLVIAPEYIKGGMSKRLAGLVSIDLGPRTDLEIERRLRLEVHLERLTSIDRRLLREMDSDRIVLSFGRDMADQAIRAERLRKLGAMGLSDELGHGRWRLDEQLEPTLRSIGEKADIIRTMQRALAAAGIERAPSEQLVFRPDGRASVTGRLLARGLSDEAADRHFLVIDGIDGRSHYAEIGKGEVAKDLPERAIVRVSPRPIVVQGNDDARHEVRPTRDKPVDVELLSAIPLERLPAYDGATWLDRELVSPISNPRDSGFGSELRLALAQRRSWLIEQGLASGEREAFACHPGMLPILERRELAKVGASLSSENGLKFAEHGPGALIEGVVRRRLDLASGRFAMIQGIREFALVPWRPDLEPMLGKEVFGLVRSAGSISWTIGRERGLEI